METLLRISVVELHTIHCCKLFLSVINNIQPLCGNLFPKSLLPISSIKSQSTIDTTPFPTLDLNFYVHISLLLILQQQTGSGKKDANNKSAGKDGKVSTYLFFNTNLKHINLYCILK